MSVKNVSIKIFLSGLALAVLMLYPSISLSFTSGSTGANGALNPQVNTVLDLPADGVLNYTTVNIPSGITVTFRKNTTNTPVVILAQGNVTIAGAISVSGSGAAHAGAAGDGNLGDDGQPGTGGPGGYDGGFGGLGAAFGGSTAASGGNGKGPGGGGIPNTYWGNVGGGGGGGFGANGGGCTTSTNCGQYGPVGSAYGTSQILPLVGGSGGGGGSGGSSFTGAGGAGGGGAILIASSGTISVTGTAAGAGIYADGGTGGYTSGVGCGGGGGGGSGGAIRLIATTISGNGYIYARGGGAGSSSSGTGCYSGAAGGSGRIRLEAETFQRTSDTTPSYTTGTPGPVFVPGLPSLRITTIAGVAVPAEPTGSADITLPSNTTQPVTIGIAATNVPLGTTVTVTVVPTTGNKVSALSAALSGTDASSSATAQITLPQGPSVLMASVTFTVQQLASLGLPIPTIAGEIIEKVRVASTIKGGAEFVFITKHGKEIPAKGFYASLAAK